jgi:hypothetical protein
MRIDLYTKILLTILVLVVLTIACNSLIQPKGVSASGADVVVICSSCAYPGLPREGHLVLMDKSSGDIWMYNDKAIAGQAQPIKWGRLVLGQPVVRSN